MPPVGDPLDLGQEWAFRWLNKNHPVQAPRGQSSLDAVDFCQDVAKAVNAYADKKRAEFEAALKRTVMAALDGETDPVSVRVSAKELLESECMTFIASKVTAGVGRPPRFPASLDS